MIFFRLRESEIMWGSQKGTEIMTRKIGMAHKATAAKNILRTILFIIAFSMLEGVAKAQAVVTLSPVARQQFLSASGTPLAGGLVYTYVSGTTNPQATYTDSSGLYLNQNPIQLDSGGFASIWLVSGDVYTFVVTDSSGSPQWTMNGITGILNLLSPGPIGTVTPNIVESTEFLSGTSTPALTGLMRLASGDQICWRNNANSGDLCINKNASDNLLFFTHPFAFLDTANTWNLSQTFSSAAILNGGGTFSGTIAGTPTFSGNLIFSGNPSFTGSGAPFSVTSNTVIPNLNASLLNGNTFANPGPIGSSTPSTGAFTGVNDSALAASSPFVCTDASKNLTTTCTTATIALFTNKNLASNVSVSSSTLTLIDSVSVTMPSSGGPWRVQVPYTYYNNGGVNVECYVSDGTHNWGLWEQNTANNITNCIGSQWSPTTYANGANVTFSVFEFNTGASTVTTVGSLTGAIPSSMQVVVESSN